MLLSQQNKENEQKTKKTNYRLTRISKQVTFDLVDRYFLPKKQRQSFNAPLYVLNVNSNDKSHMRKRLAAVFTGNGTVVLITYSKFKSILMIEKEKSA